MLHRSSIINKIVINIRIIEVIYTAILNLVKASWIPGRVASSTEFAAWLSIQSQSSTTDDVQGLHRNNRRFGGIMIIDVMDKDSRAQLDVIDRMIVATPKVVRNWWGQTKISSGD